MKKKNNFLPEPILVCKIHKRDFWAWRCQKIYSDDDDTCMCQLPCFLHKLKYFELIHHTIILMSYKMSRITAEKIVVLRKTLIFVLWIIKRVVTYKWSTNISTNLYCPCSPLVYVLLVFVEIYLFSIVVFCILPNIFKIQKSCISWLP